MATPKRLPGIKQGTRFTAYLDYAVDGVPSVFPASQLSAQVRTLNGELLIKLSIAADPVIPGRFQLWATESQTALFPAGDVYFDVRRVDSGGVVTATDTVVFNVDARITK